MLATCLSATLMGLESLPVRVEVEASRNVPFFELVGLAEASVRESRVRVKSALSQIGVDLSEMKIVVSLAPADLRKYGSAFDLAIACATLAAMNVVSASSLDQLLCLGELSLNGDLQGVRGVLPHLLSAKKRGIKRALVPFANSSEATLVKGIETVTASTLKEVVAALLGEISLPVVCSNTVFEPPKQSDLKDVKGQHGVKRALEIAAAGAHHMLMIGPPGAGKTMMARRLVSVLPKLSDDEALEIMALQSIAGQLYLEGKNDVSALQKTRPFRAPHHSISDAALVGGGDLPKPGEISLAHHGVLFLDEIAEFKRTSLEALRQPLEDGTVTVSRARAKAQFFARPLVVCAMNPCPCGYAGDPWLRCSCSAERIRAYKSKLSGPLLDRLDLHVVLAPVQVSDLMKREPSEASEEVQKRVQYARNKQQERQEKWNFQTHVNAYLQQDELELCCVLDSESQELLADSMKMFHLSARAYSKILRVARTIADLECSEQIRPSHLMEAIRFRVWDRIGP